MCYTLFVWTLLLLLLYVLEIHHHRVPSGKYISFYRDNDPVYRRRKMKSETHTHCARVWLEMKKGHCGGGNSEDVGELVESTLSRRALITIRRCRSVF